MGKHDAWVPNVSGSISFSNIKGMRIPGRAKCPRTLNHLDKETGARIASLQERNLSDTIYAPFDREGWLCYLLIASVRSEPGNSEMLAGDILTYPRIKLDSEQKSLIKNFVNDQSAADNLRDSWSANPEAVRVSFNLYRDGRIELVYEGADSTNESSFVFEAFSFLKDLVHCHKFHRHDDDAIVVPYPRDCSQPHFWLSKTIRNIHKSIVSSYRNANVKTDVQNALGRLSYLEALQVIAQKIDPNLQSINSQALRTSLEARLATVGEIEDRKSVILQVLVPTILSIVGLLIAMIQLLQVPCIKDLTADNQCVEKNPILPFELQDGAIYIVQHLLAHWYHYAIFVPLVISGVYVIAYRKHIFRWISGQWGHGIFGMALRVIFSIAAASKKLHVFATLFVLVTVVSMLFVGYRVLFGDWPAFLTTIF